MAKTTKPMPGILVPADTIVRDCELIDPNMEVQITGTLRKGFKVCRTTTTNAIVIEDLETHKKFVLGPKGVAQLAIRAGIMNE